MILFVRLWDSSKSLKILYNPSIIGTKFAEVIIIKFARLNSKDVLKKKVQNWKPTCRISTIKFQNNTSLREYI